MTRWPSRGFTLIEIIIVLLIIGLLASLAIPRFLQYRSRAMRTEAITNLGTIMHAEKAVWAEQGSYTDNLAQVGWAAEGSPRYIYGFTSDGVPAPSGLNDTAEWAAAGGASFRTDKMVDAFKNPLDEGSLPAAVVTKDSIVVGAAANLDRDAALDQWTMDQDNRLVNVVSDLEN